MVCPARAARVQSTMSRTGHRSDLFMAGQKGKAKGKGAFHEAEDAFMGKRLGWRDSAHFHASTGLNGRRAEVLRVDDPEQFFAQSSLDRRPVV